MPMGPSVLFDRARESAGSVTHLLQVWIQNADVITTTAFLVGPGGESIGQAAVCSDNEGPWGGANDSVFCRSGGTC
jgi:hypothetical protein